MAFGERRVGARGDERRPSDVRQRRLVAHLELDRRSQWHRQSRHRRHKRLQDDAHGSQGDQFYTWYLKFILKSLRHQSTCALFNFVTLRENRCFYGISGEPIVSRL
jgi:hypothetical protein